MLAAPDVDDAGALGKLGEEVLVQDAGGLRRERGMHRDEVRAGQQLVELDPADEELLEIEDSTGAEEIFFTQLMQELIGKWLHHFQMIQFGVLLIHRYPCPGLIQHTAGKLILSVPTMGFLTEL